MVGVRVAVTRQNGRTFWYVRPSGAVKDGPGTDTADVTTPSCNGSVTSVSHLSAAATLVEASVAMKTASARVTFMAASGGTGGGHGGGHHGGHHHFGGRSHVFVGVGPWFWGPPYPYWWD